MKKYIIIIILVSFLILTIGNVYAENNTTIADDSVASVSEDNISAEPIDTISVSDNVNVVNITEDTNETDLLEKSVEEEQTKQSPGFELTTILIGLILIVYIKRRNR